jgi:hypothetical protein
VNDLVKIMEINCVNFSIVFQNLYYTNLFFLWSTYCAGILGAISYKNGGRGGDEESYDEYKTHPLECFGCYGHRLTLSSGLFPGVCSLNANVSEHSVCSILIGE